MDLDRSWSAVLDPGKATDFFACPKRPPMGPVDGSWNCGLAWWCSEIARTIYRRDGRAAFFSAAGLTQLREFNAGSTRGALLVADTVGFLVFRGTDDLRNWVTNLRVAPTPSSQGGVVHHGFARAVKPGSRPKAGS